eukprot:TRINITY_DN13565_c0_g1_i1.p1 TRINITY_DN13565_c0_g1~~TRINITY_DN13565_c0_g1_i1.p1  ORF type:complete len:266 (-),score=-6.43 TRINITY_DN13565_c0_g1_i1:89-853(-)
MKGRFAVLLSLLFIGTHSWPFFPVPFNWCKPWPLPCAPHDVADFFAVLAFVLGNTLYMKYTMDNIRRYNTFFWTVFTTACTFVVEGHGLHLSANALSRVNTGPASPVVEWWDEIVGHRVWFSGWIGVTTIHVITEMLALHQKAASSRTNQWGLGVLVAGMLQGILWTFMCLEGQATTLGFILMGIIALLATVRLLSGYCFGPWLVTMCTAVFVNGCLFGLYYVYFGSLQEPGVIRPDVPLKYWPFWFLFGVPKY